MFTTRSVKILAGVTFIIALIQLAYLGISSGNNLDSAKNGKIEHNKNSAGTTMPKLDPSVFASAGNSTLGFDHIAYINMKHSFDRNDAIRMQCEISGLEMERMVGVTPDDINPNGKGLPPSSADKELLGGEKACIRSHAELWGQMVINDWDTLLILEGDATWDVNTRKISERAANAYYELRRSFYNDTEYFPTEDDPYNSNTWDVFTFGNCIDEPKYHDEFKIYYDPNSQLDQSWFDVPLTDQRVVRRAGSVLCTTAYAVSRVGARKLLLRANIDFNKPLDVMITDMISDGELKSFGLYPPAFAQWAYAGGIGAENKDSNIHDFDTPRDDNYKEIWDGIHKEKNIWKLAEHYKNKPFRNSALSEYKYLAYIQEDEKEKALIEEQKEVEEYEAFEAKIEERVREQREKEKEEERKQEEEEAKKKEEEEAKKKEEEEAKKKEKEEAKEKEENKE